MSEAANTGKEPWITEVDNEISGWDDETCEYDFATILKEFLLSDGESTEADTARKIYDYYNQEFLPTDPLMRFQYDKRMQPFLFAFWQAAYIGFARFIPYNNSNQDKLVRLISELQRLPPSQFKISGEDCFVWTREPYYGLMMTAHWSGLHPTELKESRGGEGDMSFEEVCDTWVNFSSFLARVTEAGLIGDCYNYARFDISQGLDEDLPHGLMRDSKVMVAAQYILLAGKTLAKECFDKDQWRRRAEKLKEISKEEGGSNTVLASATEEAHNYMVSLHPEIFLASED